MSPEVRQVLLTLAVLALTVSLPMLPSIVIYRLFPETTVAVKGPFRGLTIKAAGAFAAYFITFLAVTPFAWRSFNVVTTLLAPTWTISGRIVAYDANGKAINQPDLYSKISLTMQPETYGAADGRLWLKLPEVDGRIPFITVNIPKFGSGTINLNDGSSADIQMNRDDVGRKIEILSDIPIRYNPLIGKEYKPESAPNALGQPVAGSPSAPPPPVENAPAPTQPPT